MSGEEGSNPVILTTRLDPNRSHPLLQKDVVARVADVPWLNSYAVQAIVWDRGLKTDPRYCWVDARLSQCKYSEEAVAVIRRVTETEVTEIRARYGRRPAT